MSPRRHIDIPSKRWKSNGNGSGCDSEKPHAIFKERNKRDDIIDGQIDEKECEKAENNQRVERKGNKEGEQVRWRKEG